MIKKLVSLTTFLAISAVVFVIVMIIAAWPALLTVSPYFVFTLAGIGVIASGIWLWTFTIQRQNYAKQTTIETERVEQKKQFELATMTAVINQVRQNLIYPVVVAETRFSHYPSAKITPVQGAVPLLEAEPLDLLDHIADLGNLLIVGGKGSGKTSLMQWLESMRQDSGRTIILDSHAQPAQWRGETIGQGRRYGNIKNAMIGLLGKLDQRYEKYSKGQSDFEPVHQFIDEFTLLPRTLKDLDYNIQDYSIPMLTEGRKVAINCIWGIHSDRAAALGLQGAMDILECFDVIIHLKHVGKQFYALCDFGEGQQTTRYRLPGPFVVSGAPAQPLLISESVDDSLRIESGQSVGSVADSEPNEPEPEPTIEPNEAEMSAIMAFVSVRDSGKFSWRKATQEAFGSGKFGAKYSTKLKSVLDKFNVDYGDL